MDEKQFPSNKLKVTLSLLRLLDYSAYTSSNLVDPTCHSPLLHSTNETSTLTNGHSHPMTNGYNASTKSRSCETNLDSCGRKVSDDLATSSSSLIDLPTSPLSNHADYDNLENVNDREENQREIIPINQPSAPPITRMTNIQSQSPIFCELDRKVKDEIDARLKDIDDEFEPNCKKRIPRETTRRSLFF